MAALSAEKPRTETIPGCPVCDSPRAELELIIPDHLHGVAGKYSYVRCANCRTVYQNPRVVDKDLSLCYPPDYYTHHSPQTAVTAASPAIRSARDNLRGAILHYADGACGAHLSGFTRLSGWILWRVPWLRVRARFGLIDALSPQGAVKRKCLEVGPGQGQTLRNLRSTGWDAMGLDIDPQAARTAASVSGCKVQVGTLAATGLSNASFELILMSHVVEHLPDLRPSLERAFTLLAHRGRLVMFYPNPESLGARYDPHFSCNWDAPRHLALPPRQAMTSLLTDIGFSSVTASSLARNAAGYRQRARKYRAAAARKTFRDETTLGDRAFGVLENICVLFGSSAGEEILVTAINPGSSAHSQLRPS
jgi:2-polyprenyl-3-methyl-5-hydroxy-6-metoxy-1,4-benzoquinol methylase